MSRGSGPGKTHAPEPVRQRTGARGFVVRVRLDQRPRIRELASFSPTPVPAPGTRAHVSMGMSFTERDGA